MLQRSYNGYYACERCKIKGYSVKKNVRIYPKLTCKLRTHESFEKKKQVSHHLKHETSPLLAIPDFKIIKDVLLDYMHLLCLSLIKYLMEKWVGKKRTVSKFKRKKIKKFRELLNLLKTKVPSEFQRKDFDLDLWNTWKATQFRFVLL